MLVVAALFAVVLLAAWQRDSDTCTDSVKDVLFAIRDDESAIEDATDRVEEECEGSGRLVDAGGVLFQHGHPEAAARILREAVDREPESFSAWAGLAAVLRDGGDADEAAGAAARARSLNSYYAVRD